MLRTVVLNISIFKPYLINYFAFKEISKCKYQIKNQIIKQQGFFSDTTTHLSIRWIFFHLLLFLHTKRKILDLFSQNLNNKKYKWFRPYICRGYKGTYYIYYPHPEKFTRTKKTTKTKSKNEAREKLDIFIKNLYKGVKDEQIKTLSDLNKAILYYYKESHSKRTLEMYSGAINKYIRIYGTVELGQVSLLSIENYKIKIAQFTSKTTANINFRTLKSAFNFAKKYGAIHENPCTAINQFKIPECQKKCFESEELSILFENLSNPVLKRIVCFALYSVPESEKY